MTLHKCGMAVVPNQACAICRPGQGKSAEMDCSCAYCAACSQGVALQARTHCRAPHEEEPASSHHILAGLVESQAALQVLPGFAACSNLHPGDYIAVLATLQSMLADQFACLDCHCIIGWQASLRVAKGFLAACSEQLPGLSICSLTCVQTAAISGSALGLACRPLCMLSCQPGQAIKTAWRQANKCILCAW